MHGEPLPEKEEEPVSSFTFGQTATPSQPQTAKTEEKQPDLNLSQPEQTSSGKNQTIRIDLSSLDIAEDRRTQPKRMISFFCKNCQQEIEAPTDMAGSSCDCPSCGTAFEVPFFSDLGTLHGADLEHTEDDLKNIKGRTIRIEVPDDI